MPLKFIQSQHIIVQKAIAANSNYLSDLDVTRNATTQHKTIDDGITSHSIDYIQYRCEGLIGIVHLASVVYNIPSSLLHQLETFIHAVRDAGQDFENENMHQLRNISPGYVDDQHLIFQKIF